MAIRPLKTREDNDFGSASQLAQDFLPATMPAPGVNASP
jgi:hypothetical protein